MTAGTGIPVVFAPVFDPVKSGIVKSLVKPGGNLIGIKAGGHSAKALYWLLKVVPDIKNIFVPPSSLSANSTSYLFRRTLEIFSFFMKNRNKYGASGVLGIK